MLRARSGLIAAPLVEPVATIEDAAAAGAQPRVSQRDAGQDSSGFLCCEKSKPHSRDRRSLAVFHRSSPTSVHGLVGTKLDEILGCRLLLAAEATSPFSRQEMPGTKEES
jgi:hypothetical protein